MPTLLVRPLLVRHHSASRALRRLTAPSSRGRASRLLRHEIVSLAGLLGVPVKNQAGQVVGRLVDVVARLRSEQDYPPVTGLVLRVGHRRSFIDAAAIEHIGHRVVALRTARIDLRDFMRRPGEVLLARDILDHQLVDTDDVQVIRAADLYLATIAGQVRLVGVDVSWATLARRLGPRSWRGRPTPDRVIDWQAVEPFGDDVTATPAALRLRAPHSALRKLRPAELADLLEDLGRPGRQELLASLDAATAADALEEMEPTELTALLREAEPARAGELVAAMEPDEAVDALRDLPVDERAEILDRMPEHVGRNLAALLEFRDDRAGGVMTTTIARATAQETVAEVAARLAERAEHRSEIDSVAVVDDHGRLVADLSLFELVIADPESLLGDLLGDPLGGRPAEQVATVGPETDIDDVAHQLIASRRSSVLVVDPAGRPVGRILADDVLDAIRTRQSRLHFPRLLS